MNRQIFVTVNEMCLKAAEDFRSRAKAAIAAQGRFCAVLAGGSTPKGVYAALAQLEDVPWSDVHLFWGDERCVPPDHPDSNFGMVKATLLGSVVIPHENIHRIKGELGASAAVLEYQAQLEVMFDGLPVFDLIHLGLGFDGHTASLFPGQSTLEQPNWVLKAFPNPDLTPQVARVTLGFSILNAALGVQFFVTGVGKADIFSKLGQGLYPADRVASIETQWWVDVAVIENETSNTK